MADKIKIQKEDIEAGIYELPEGYSFKKVKTKSEQIAELTAELNLLEITQDPEPSEEVLRSFARAGIVPEYYERKIAMQRIRDTLQTLES